MGEVEVIAIMGVWCKGVQFFIFRAIMLCSEDPPGQVIVLGVKRLAGFSRAFYIEMECIYNVI